MNSHYATHAAPKRAAHLNAVHLAPVSTATPATPQPLFSRRELRRLVAEMID